MTDTPKIPENAGLVAAIKSTSLVGLTDLKDLDPVSKFILHGGYARINALLPPQP